MRSVYLQRDNYRNVSEMKKTTREGTSSDAVITTLGPKERLLEPEERKGDAEQATLREVLSFSQGTERAQSDLARGGHREINNLTSLFCLPLVFGQVPPPALPPRAKPN